MTIIEPNKQKSKKRTRPFMTLMIFVIVLGAYASISLYNETVELRHGVLDGEKKLEALRVENAELKNKVYGSLDMDSAAKAAAELGLVLDKNPLYIESGIDGLASNL